MEEIRDQRVRAVFAAAPPDVQRRLLELRELIRTTAEATEGVGRLEETLRWGEPAYVTSESGSGTAVRLGWKPSAPDQVSVLVHCRTTLISDVRATLSPALQFDGNRRIVLPVCGPIPEGPLRIFVQAALTYHLRNRRKGHTRSPK